MDSLDLSLYRTFYLVANHGNISKAAKELYVSQPAISKAIQKLEDSLNIQLFTRTSRGVILTGEGEVLYKHTKLAFEELYAGKRSIEHMNELGLGHMKIGVSTTLCKYVLLPYLNDFVHNNPHINVTIECQSSYKTLELLIDNKIDIGLVNEPYSLKNLDFFEAFEIQDIFVATESYLDHLKIREHYPRNKSMDMATLFKTCNLMLLDEKNLTRKYTNEYLNANNIETNQVLEVTSMDLLIEFAKTSLGVACVIKEFVENEIKNKELIEIPLSLPIEKRKIGFVYNTNRPQNKAAEKFINFYKNKFSNNHL